MQNFLIHVHKCAYIIFYSQYCYFFFSFLHNKAEGLNLKTIKPRKKKKKKFEMKQNYKIYFFVQNENYLYANMYVHNINE